MSNVLEYSCESFAIALLQLQPALSGFSIYHHDQNAPGKLQVVTVRGIQGKQHLEGCQPFEVELTMEWTSEASLGVPDTIGGPIAEAMRNAFYKAVPGSVDGSAFQFIDLEPEAVGDRSDEPKARHRQYKVPLLARLVGT